MRFMAGLIGAVMLWSAGAVAEPQNYKLDPEHTTLALLVDHVGYARLLGRFRDVQGSFTYNEETQELSDLQVVVKTASFWSDHERRDAHVHGPDFLHVEKYPEMVFTADSGTPKGPSEGTVTGKLTLLGQTRPLTLYVTLNKSAEYPFGHEKYTLGISARGSLQRSEYGMTYAVANGLVGDEVDIIIETEAIQQD